MKKQFHKLYRQGFTLIEMVIVVFLVVLIASVTLSSFGALNNKQTLDSQVSLIKSTIQKARAESLNSKNGIAHGVTFASTTLTTFDQGTTTTRVLTYTTGVRLASHTLGTSSITFAKVTGSPSAAGTLVYTLTRGSTVIATTSLTINSLGVVQ